MSIFTKNISRESFEKMLDNVGQTLDGINNNRPLLCPHVKAVMEQNGGIQDYESVAEKDRERKISVNLDGVSITLNGITYRCEECGKYFFVPTDNMNSKGVKNKFKSFAETYLNIMRLFRDMSYAEPTVRGLYQGDIGLDVPAKIRGRVGKEYLDRLAGKKVSTQGGVARTDRTLQLDRALFLAHLEARIEIYQGIIDFFNGEETVIGEGDIDLSAFGTGMKDSGSQPYTQNRQQNNIQSTSNPRYLDMFSQNQAQQAQAQQGQRGGRTKKQQNSGSSKEMQKDT